MIAGLLATIGSVLLLLWAIGFWIAAGVFAWATSIWWKEHNTQFVVAGALLTSFLIWLGNVAFRWWL